MNSNEVYSYKSKISNNQTLPYIEQNIDYNSIYNIKKKIIIVGSSYVGKTSIFSLSNDISTPTIGLDVIFRYLMLDNGSKVKLQIMDMTGDERFNNVLESHYKTADGVIFVYDITDLNTYNYMIKMIGHLSKISNHKIQKIIIGNKIDLEHKRAINKIKVENFTKNIDIPYYETSIYCKFEIDMILKKLLENINQNINQNINENNCNSNDSMDITHLLLKKENSKCCTIL